RSSSTPAATFPAAYPCCPERAGEWGALEEALIKAMRGTAALKGGWRRGHKPRPWPLGALAGIASGRISVWEGSGACFCAGPCRAGQAATLRAGTAHFPDSLHFPERENPTRRKIARPSGKHPYKTQKR